MRAKGYQVSDKSVLAPTTWVKRLGKEVDLDALSISNNISVITRIIACLVVLWGGYVSSKDFMRVVGLIGWLGTPARGHLPFLGGVYSALFLGRSDRLKVTPRLWISLVTAAMIVLPPFAVPPHLVTSWLCLKWVSVDAAEYSVARGCKRYRIGMYDPAGGVG